MWYKAPIIKGKGRGKALGFPTLNLQPPSDFKLKKGVYTCLARLEKKLYRGLLYWGPSLTFDEKETRLEIHLLDFDKKLKFGRFSIPPRHPEPRAKSKGEGSPANAESGIQPVRRVSPEILRSVPSLRMTRKRKILFKIGKFLRKGKKFSSSKKLVEQIKKDIVY